MFTYDQLTEVNITGLSKEAIHEEFAKHHGGLTKREANFLSSEARRGKDVKWKRADHKQRRVWTFIVTAVKVGRGHQYCLSVTSELFDKKPWPKPVKLNGLGTTTADKIVHNGLVKHHVGIGWIDGPDAREVHYYEYPTLEGN